MGSLLMTSRRPCRVRCLQRGGFGLCVPHILWGLGLTSAHRGHLRAPRGCTRGATPWRPPAAVRFPWRRVRNQPPCPRPEARETAGPCGPSGAPRATGQLAGVKVTQYQGWAHVWDQEASCAAGRAWLRPAYPPPPVGAATPDLLLVTRGRARPQQAQSGVGGGGKAWEAPAPQPSPDPLQGCAAPGRGGGRGLTACPRPATPLPSSVGADEPGGAGRRPHRPCSPAPWSSPPAWRTAPCCG